MLEEEKTHAEEEEVEYIEYTTHPGYYVVMGTFIILAIVVGFHIFNDLP